MGETQQPTLTSNQEPPIINVMIIGIILAILLIGFSIVLLSCSMTITIQNVTGQQEPNSTSVTVDKLKLWHVHEPKQITRICFPPM